MPPGRRREHALWFPPCEYFKDFVYLTQVLLQCITACYTACGQWACSSWCWQSSFCSVDTPAPAFALKHFVPLLAPSSSSAAENFATGRSSGVSTQRACLSQLLLSYFWRLCINPAGISTRRTPPSMCSYEVFCLLVQSLPLMFLEILSIDLYFRDWRLAVVPVGRQIAVIRILKRLGAHDRVS
jgi:hypothetical protein